MVTSRHQFFGTPDGITRFLEFFRTEKDPAQLLINRHNAEGLSDLMQRFIVSAFTNK